MSNRKHRDNQEICSRKVRELAQSGVNKHCFECNQPGVTYTDITVGTFVCTSCSGMLFIKRQTASWSFSSFYAVMVQV
ncbi:Arf-GAP domain and FG repeat-containing protein 2 [Characodon lateralis]|uniref:Arf-GAP domain and FG repeat-containing protein 2 n=1 Tax=Characodon lateralis TaxID=208331 RepID=A0ABU7DU89_9TELE|nr:Arf-GAP domain and FG repeat-containing protein 2 [Characodon lateralis]